MDLFGDDFMSILVVVAIVSVLGSIAWWVFIAFVIKKAIDVAARSFDQQAPALEQLIRQCANLPASRRVPMQGSIMTQLAQLNSQLGQINAVHRGRYEARMGELSSMAANAGIDWTPPSY